MTYMDYNLRYWIIYYAINGLFGLIGTFIKYRQYIKNFNIKVQYRPISLGKTCEKEEKEKKEISPKVSTDEDKVIKISIESDKKSMNDYPKEVKEYKYNHLIKFIEIFLIFKFLFFPFIEGYLIKWRFESSIYDIVDNKFVLINKISNNSTCYGYTFSDITILKEYFSQKFYYYLGLVFSSFTKILGPLIENYCENTFKAEMSKTSKFCRFSIRMTILTFSRGLGCGELFFSFVKLEGNCVNPSFVFLYGKFAFLFLWVHYLIFYYTLGYFLMKNCQRTHGAGDQGVFICGFVIIIVLAGVLSIYDFLMFFFTWLTLKWSTSIIIIFHFLGIIHDLMKGVFYEFP